MTISSEDLARFFKTHNSRFNKCLEPQMKCEQNAIRAHSIQNARVIDLIATKSHVIALAVKFSDAGPQIEFESIRRNEVSTFTGLCNEHDTSLFKPLDTKPFDINDREQLFLLAYRSVTRELHVVMEGAAKIQSAYSSRVERGIDPADDMSPAGIVATEHLLIAFLTYQYRAEYYDRPLLAANYDAIEHDVIVLDNQPPRIAVSSLFSLDEIHHADGEIVRVVLNVLPVDQSKTLAIFSYPKKDRQKAAPALDRVLSTQGQYQKYELSKLILERIENFLISPIHFESWGPTKTALIREMFVETALNRSSVKEHQDLMLF